MKKRILLLYIILIIIIFIIIAGYIFNKNEKDNYIESQKNRIDLYFKYNLNDYRILKITKFEKIQWEIILYLAILIMIKV